MEYAKERGRWWAAKYPLYAEDIIATAIFALVRALDHHVPEENTKGYLSAAIKNGIIDFLEDNYLIKVPRSEIIRRKLFKESLETLPRAYLVGDLPKNVTDKFVWSSELHREYDLWDLGTRTREFPTWLHLHAKDVLELLDLSEFEQELIRLRVEKRSFSEISVLLKRTKSTLHEALDKIRQRYLRLCANKKRYVRRPDDAPKA